MGRRGGWDTDAGARDRGLARHRRRDRGCLRGAWLHGRPRVALRRAGRRRGGSRVDRARHRGVWRGRRAGRQRRHRPLPALRRDAARPDRGAHRRQLARHRLHGPGRPARHARARARSRGDRLLGRGHSLLPGRGGLRRHQVRPARLRRGAAPRAEGHRRRADDGLPGPDPQRAARPREGTHARLVQARPRGAGGAARRGARRSGGEGPARGLPSAQRPPAADRARRCAPGSPTRCCAASWTGARRREPAALPADQAAAGQERARAARG